MSGGNHKGKLRNLGTHFANLSNIFRSIWFSVLQERHISEHGERHQLAADVPVVLYHGLEQFYFYCILLILSRHLLLTTPWETIEGPLV